MWWWWWSCLLHDNHFDDQLKRGQMSIECRTNNNSLAHVGRHRVKPFERFESTDKPSSDFRRTRVRRSKRRFVKSIATLFIRQSDWQQTASNHNRQPQVASFERFQWQLADRNDELLANVIDTCHNSNHNNNNSIGKSVIDSTSKINATHIQKCLLLSSQTKA